MENTESKLVVTEWLHDLGKTLKADLQLNDEGVCTFKAGEEVISIEISEDYPQVHLYSTLISFPEDDYDTALLLMAHALELNAYQALTRGGAIAAPPGGGGLIFCYNVPIQGTDSRSFAHILDAFYDTVFNLKADLAAVKASTKEEESEASDKVTSQVAKITKPMNWVRI